MRPGLVARRDRWSLDADAAARFAANPALIFDEAAFAASLPADWIVGPCVTDSTSSRTLKGGYWADTVNMTNLGCVDFCAGKGYSYAGTVYSQVRRTLLSSARVRDRASPN